MNALDILLINKFFFLFGGSERVLFEEERMLKHAGHRTHHFSMAHERNFDSPDSEYFVSNVDYRRGGAAYTLGKLPRIAGGNIYSFEARRRLRALLKAKDRINLAHVHLIAHQLSPSILPLLREEGIPVVHTAHEYKLVCPAYHLYIHHEGEICERCLGGAYRHIITHRCLKNSLAASTLAGVSQYLHRWSGIYENNIDLFIAPSQFLAGKLSEGGIPAEQIRYLHNALDLSEYEPDFTPGDYAVFLGRLQPEKGVRTLLEAMRNVPGGKLKIVGEGEDAGTLKAYAATHGLEHVEFMGYRTGDELRALMRGAAFLVLPSEWYENCPMVTLEAYAYGKPVVASRIGGIPESIDEGETGLLYEPGDAAQLADRMNTLFADRAKMEAMGRAGRRKVERYGEDHYGDLMAIYEEAIARRG